MFRLPVRRTLALQQRTRAFQHLARGPGPELTHQADSHGIPIRPTWSVTDLLSSYPSPTLSDSTLKHLHDLSALIPPEEGTLLHTKLKHELEELVRLVEAVKLVNTDNVQPAEWGPSLGDGAEKGLSNEATIALQPELSGKALLEHASRTADDFYVVEADRHHRAE